MASVERLRQTIDKCMKLSDRHLRRYLRLRTELEELCVRWDSYSKGESMTTAAIRKVIKESWEEPGDIEPESLHLPREAETGSGQSTTNHDDQSGP